MVVSLWCVGEGSHGTGRRAMRVYSATTCLKQSLKGPDLFSHIMELAILYMVL